MMKKIFLMVLGCVIGCCLIGCGKKEIYIVTPEGTVKAEDEKTTVGDNVLHKVDKVDSPYSGKLYKKNSDVIAFTCSRFDGDAESDGGSSINKYNCVFRNGIAHIFGTLLSTTGDSGYTCEYIINFEDDTFDDIGALVSAEDWGQLYRYCDETTSNMNGDVVSEGMHDSASQNNDGSYKWWSRFDELVGENVLGKN